jgi:hypothetical protein
MELFLRSLRSSFQVFLGSIGVFGVAFAVFAYLVPFSTQVPAFYLFASIGLALVVCFTLLDAMRWLIKEGCAVVPEAIGCHTIGEKTLLLFRRSEVLGVGMQVSIYYLENKCEILIGQGYVETITNKKLVQIVVLSAENGTDDKWKSILERSPDALKCTFAKPGHQIGRFE